MPGVSDSRLTYGEAQISSKEWILAVEAKRPTGERERERANMVKCGHSIAKISRLELACFEPVSHLCVRRYVGSRCLMTRTELAALLGDA